MLYITVPETELFDEQSSRFINVKRTKLQLEHSLVSLSKWEAKWQKVFLDRKIDKSHDEIIDYIRCMTLTQNVDPNVYKCLTTQNIEEIEKYIEEPMTATWFSKEKTSQPNSKPITNELIYYWMFTLNIHMDCQKWHLNRLLTLIRVCNEESNPSKKRSPKEVAADYARLNAERRKQWNTKG